MQMFPGMFPGPDSVSLDGAGFSRFPLRNATIGTAGFEPATPRSQSEPDAPEPPSRDRSRPRGTAWLTPIRPEAPRGADGGREGGCSRDVPGEHPTQAAESAWAAHWRERAEAARFAADRGAG